MRLEKKEAEYENTIKELQYDIGQLRHELHSQQFQSSTDVKERSDTIRELTLQNERLHEEVRQASCREEELTSQVQSLREKVTNRRSSMHIHISQLEILQQEVILDGSSSFWKGEGVAASHDYFCPPFGLERGDAAPKWPEMTFLGKHFLPKEGVGYNPHKPSP